MEELEDDFTSYAIDMRGCGESDKVRDGYSPDQMAADVAAFMEAQNIGSAVIVGKQDLFFPDPSPFEAIPNVTIESFKASSHVPMFQEAEKFKSVITDFAR